MMTQTKRTVLLASILVAAALLMGLLFVKMAPQGRAGTKTVTVEVIVEDAVHLTKTLRTQAPYLGDALTEAGLIEGAVSSFGMYVTAVDGIEADEAQRQWWRITKDGALTDTSVDATPIEDGDHFELTLSVW